MERTIASLKMLHRLARRGLFFVNSVPYVSHAYGKRMVGHMEILSLGKISTRPPWAFSAGGNSSEKEGCVKERRISPCPSSIRIRFQDFAAEFVILSEDQL